MRRPAERSITEEVSCRGAGSRFPAEEPPCADAPTPPRAAPPPLDQGRGRLFVHNSGIRASPLIVTLVKWHFTWSWTGN